MTIGRRRRRRRVQVSFVYQSARKDFADLRSADLRNETQGLAFRLPAQVEHTAEGHPPHDELDLTGGAGASVGFDESVDLAG